MAKAAIRKKEGQELKVHVESREEADLALRQIAALEEEIQHVEASYGEKIRNLQEAMIEQADYPRRLRAAYEAALEKWARQEEKKWEGRTLVLNFGRLFFRMGSGAILFKRSKEFILQRLRSRGMHWAVRKIEEPDKEALKGCDDSVLKAIGCKREKPDYFHYEVFKTEVK